MKLKKGMRSLLLCSLLAALIVPSAAFAAGTEATAEIPVTVNAAKGTPAGTKFTVTLTPNDTSDPMPAETAIKTVTTDSKEQAESLDVSFGPITYTMPGDYYYTVTQEEGKAENVTYDATSYTVMVRVENQNDASGNYVGLKASVSAWEGSQDAKPDTDAKLAKLTFDNAYDEPTTATTETTEDTSTTEEKSTTEETSKTTEKKKTSAAKKTKSVKTGDNSNIYFWTVLAVIAAAACIMLLLADQKKRKTKK